MNGNFLKLEMLSDSIFKMISDRVLKATSYPLKRIGEFKFSRIDGRQILRVDATHDNHPISFIVSFREGILLEVDKYMKEYRKEINYVSRFIIDYIKRGYIHG